jgi:hypothetical protein
VLDAARPSRGPSADAERDWLDRLDASLDREPSHHSTQHAPEAPILCGPPHPASLTPDALLKNCTLGKSRSGGPGGQHRNKVETQVELTHEPTGVRARAGERRSVRENTREALWRLRLTLAVRVRCPVLPGDARSELWRRRCVSQSGSPGRLIVNLEHDDFPALLAEALDVLWTSGLDVKSASARLLCSHSQLLKLLRGHPAAWTWLNAQRAARGQHPLK